MTTEYGLGRRLVRPGVPAAAHRELPVPGPVRNPRRRIPYPALVIGADIASLAVPTLTYTLVGDGTALAAAAVHGITACCLLLAGAWSPAVPGRPARELGRLLRGLLAATGAVGVLSLALDTLAGRPWVLGVLPLAAVLAVTGRLALRRAVPHPGTAPTRVLAVGSHEAIVALTERTQRSPELGWTVVAACTPTGAGPRGSATLRGVPVIGDLDSVPSLARRSRFDAVSVSPAPGWSPRRLQQLAWHLEGSRTELVVDPGLVENAGPRTRMATVEGLPLLRLTHPTLPAAGRVAKGVLDRVAAALLLVLTAPLLAVVTVAVWRDGGPAFVQEKRLGAGGRAFDLLTFRCTDLLDGTVTPVGAFLRRFGLHALPQLVHVLTGAMAIVGPRPVRPGNDRRRPLVKPGLTGLWTLGPLHDADPDRLENDYAENWTPALDARLLGRSVAELLVQPEETAAQSPRRRVSR